MMEGAGKKTVYQCQAWYYVPCTVRIRIAAGSPEEALDRLKSTEDADPEFWSDDDVSVDGAGNTSYEVLNGDGSSPLLTDPGHELAPDGATDVLRWMLTEINEFDEDCGATGSTDTDVVWQMLNGYRRRIEELMGDKTEVAAAEAS